MSNGVSQDAPSVESALIERFTQRVASGAVAARSAEMRDDRTGNITSHILQAAMAELQELIGGANCLEIGTYFADTTRGLAEMAARTGGKVATIDPYGGHRVPGIIESWPAPLRESTEYSDMSSMQFFMSLEDKRVPKGKDAPFDIIFVDGNHAFEYALYDILVSVSFLKPSGVLVVDNIDQSGPLRATEFILEHFTHWRALEIGDNRSKLEAICGSNAAIVFAPPGVEIGTMSSKFDIRDLERAEMKELRIPIVPHESAGVLQSTCNLYFSTYDNHLTGDGLFSKVRTLETEIQPGQDKVVIVLDEPLAVDVKTDRPGYNALELELEYRASSGPNPLLDISRKIEVVC